MTIYGHISNLLAIISLCMAMYCRYAREDADSVSYWMGLAIFNLVNAR